MPPLALLPAFATVGLGSSTVAAGAGGAVGAGVAGDRINEEELRKADKAAFQATPDGRQQMLRGQRMAKRFAAEKARLDSGKPPPVPYSDPSEPFFRVLARQASDRQIREGSGRSGAFLQPDAAGRYRMAGRR